MLASCKTWTDFRVANIWIIFIFEMYLFTCICFDWVSVCESFINIDERKKMQKNKSERREKRKEKEIYRESGWKQNSNKAKKKKLVKRVD